MRAIRSLILLSFAAWSATLVANLLMAARRRQDVPALPAEDADAVELVAVFDELRYHSTAPAFRGGTLELRFGGGVVDLRDATLDPAGALLRVDAAFGGVALLVPREWRVVSHVGGIGGVGDSRDTTDDADPGAPTLTLTGRVFFGGVGVSSADPRAGEAAVAA